MTHSWLTYSEMYGGGLSAHIAIQGCNLTLESEAVVEQNANGSTIFNFGI